LGIFLGGPDLVWCIFKECLSASYWRIMHQVIIFKTSR